jgi:Ca2+-binding EF-hand superfamily protein
MIDLAEFTALRPSKGKEQVEEVFKMMDANADGAITQEEMNARMEKPKGDKKPADAAPAPVKKP